MTVFFLLDHNILCFFYVVFDYKLYAYTSCMLVQVVCLYIPTRALIFEIQLPKRLMATI